MRRTNPVGVCRPRGDGRAEFGRMNPPGETAGPPFQSGPRDVTSRPKKQPQADT